MSLRPLHRLSTGRPTWPNGRADTHPALLSVNDPPAAEQAGVAGGGRGGRQAGTYVERLRSAIRRSLRLEVVVAVVLGLAALSAGFYPIIHRYNATPAGRSYVGTTGYTPDYAGYVGAIEQGRRGSWKHVDKFTSEDMPRTFLYLPYLVIGHVAWLLGLSSVAMYHVARLLIGALFLAVLYWFITVAVGDALPAAAPSTRWMARFGAFVLAVGSGSWFVVHSGDVDFPRLSHAVADFQLPGRILSQPHFMLGNLAFLFGLICLLRHVQGTGWRWTIASMAAIGATGFFRPSHGAALVLAAGMFTAVEAARSTLRHPEERAWRWALVFTLGNGAALALGSAYLFWLERAHPQLPYFLYDQGGAPREFTPFQWLLSEGPLLMLAALSFVLVRSSPAVRLLQAALVTVVAMTFVLPHIIDFNPVRAMQVPAYAVCGVLGALLLARLGRPQWMLAAVAGIVIITVPTGVVELHHEIHLYHDAYYIWPPSDYLDGLKTLDSVSRDDDRVLSSQSLSNLVPMYAGNTVYWGHPNETLDYARKQGDVERFYRGQMSDADARLFLQRNRIKFVLWGREERSLGAPKYGFLRRVGSSADLEIYATGIAGS